MEEIAAIHQVISENRLVDKVERETRLKWNVGSRATYYNAVRKSREGATTLSLTERLMLETAAKLVAESSVA